MKCLYPFPVGQLTMYWIRLASRRFEGKMVIWRYSSSLISKTGTDCSVTSLLHDEAAFMLDSWFFGLKVSSGLQGIKYLFHFNILTLLADFSAFQTFKSIGDLPLHYICVVANIRKIIFYFLKTWTEILPKYKNVPCTSHVFSD